MPNRPNPSRARAGRVNAAAQVENLEGRCLFALPPAAADVAGLAFTSAPLGFTAVGDTMYFYAADAAAGAELWKSDGTAAGTVRVKDIRPGPAPSAGTSFTDPLEMRAAGETLFFTANDGVHGTEVWASDGTDAGTRMVNDVDGGDSLTYPRGLADVQEALFYVSGKGREPGLAVWTTRDAGGGARRVGPSDLDPSYGTDEVRHAASGRLYYFIAPQGGFRAGNGGYELWKSDGTDAGTTRVRDINPGDGPSFPTWLTDVGDRLYFSAADGTERRLWKTDGTEAGTVLIADVIPGGNDNVTNLVNVGGTVFFKAGATGELWKSDGTEGGTVPVRPAAGAITAAGEMTRVGGRLFFTSGANDAELWTTDGTPEGTVRLANFLRVPGNGPRTAFGLTDVNGRLYFGVADERESSSLWTSDGTAAGTVALAEGALGAIQDYRFGDGHPTWRSGLMAGMGGRLFFGVDDDAGGALWTSDGTPQGTFPVTDTRPAARVVGRHLFYDGSAFEFSHEAGRHPNDSAIAPDKSALMPGDAATFPNVTSYTGGINGVMVDVSGLRDPGSVTAADFVLDAAAGPGGAWAPAPASASITVRSGAGADSSHRITLTWGGNAVRNGWLRVTVKANADTGLAEPDVFAFGNLIGETGDATSNLRVSALDLATVRRALNTTVPITHAADFNRDGRVNALDLAAARGALGRTLALPPGLTLATEEEDDG